MSRYYVVLPDGQRYGPATPEHLADWVYEGRVVPDSVIEDQVTGQRMLAGQLPGLPFGQASAVLPTPYSGQPVQPAPQPFPYQQPYQQVQPQAQPPYDPFAASPAQPPVWSIATFVLAAISCFGCNSAFGLITATGAVVCGLVSRSRGEKAAGCALTFAAVVLFALALVFFAGRMLQASQPG
ncbi:MAG: hypothetical protein JSS66_18225 [Armatimonadetes bacterium]|nr:hypothetical protein [Armatimonadota bacterium]